MSLGVNKLKIKNSLIESENENLVIKNTNNVFDTSQLVKSIDYEKHEAIKELCNKSVIHVYNHEHTYSASAFFISIPSFDPNYDYVGTATHNIYNHEENELYGQAFLHFNSPVNEIYEINLKTDTVIYSIASDLAILRVPKKENRVLLTISDNKNIQSGDTLYCCGYTAGKDFQNITICNIKDVSWKNNTTPINSVLIDNNTMMGGNSGGPWINTDGEVACLSSWGSYYRIINLANGGNVHPEDMAFPAFGVQTKGFLKMIERFNKTNQSIPYQFKGKSIFSPIRNRETGQLQDRGTLTDLLFADIIRNYPWHKYISGAALNIDTETIPAWAVISQIKVDGEFKEIGILDHQYKDFAFDIYYCEENEIGCKWFNWTDDVEFETVLPLRERLDEEDYMFIQFSTLQKERNNNNSQTPYEEIRFGKK